MLAVMLMFLAACGSNNSTGPAGSSSSSGGGDQPVKIGAILSFSGILLHCLKVLNKEWSCILS